MEAVGIHVFAGGFSMGVKNVFDLNTHLETHGFGLETAEALCDVECINCNAEDWPDVPGQFAFGNPRCTGFSCVTAGLGENTHGAWSAPTRDIHELCEYAAGRYDIIVWESVQQAYSVGRELLDYLRDDIFVPQGYRIAHLFINAGTFNNAQQRKRYFFVAYRDDRNFNIVPPSIGPYYTNLADVIWGTRKTEGNEMHLNNHETGYTYDTYRKLAPHDRQCLPILDNGWSLNNLAKYYTHLLPERFQQKWKHRNSDMPFSMHCIRRLNWLRPAPTMTSSCGNYIHPDLDRPLSVGELSTIMGWPDIPRGPNPIAQIAKGIVPGIGEWLAEQAELYLNNHWGKDDWESSYNHNTGVWEGASTNGQVEKVIDLTRYCGKQFDLEKYDESIWPKNRKRRFQLVEGTWCPKPY